MTSFNNYEQFEKHGVLLKPSSDEAKAVDAEFERLFPLLPSAHINWKLAHDIVRRSFSTADALADFLEKDIVNLMPSVVLNQSATVIPLNDNSPNVILRMARDISQCVDDLFDVSPVFVVSVKNKWCLEWRHYYDITFGSFRTNRC